jgi:redox-sensitive bicupin YhaK (pirin superfamily)
MGGPIERGNQFFGDMEQGPWVMINSLNAGFASRTHAHSQDEIIYIVQGSLTLEGGKACGAGTLIFMEKDTEYGFTVGNEGVRFLNVRGAKEGFRDIRYVGEASEVFKG